MEKVRNKLAYTLNIALILLTLGISFLGFLTFRNLNFITEKLHRDTQPNVNFLYYKDLMINISQMEDHITNYRLKHQDAEIKSFRELSVKSRTILDTVKALHLTDANHHLYSDSLLNLLGKYERVLEELSKIERSNIEETLTDLELSINNWTENDNSPNASGEQNFFQRIFSKRSKSKQPPAVLDTLENQMTKLIASVKETTLNELDQRQNLEMNYMSQVNLLQMKMMELLDYMEAREITMSKINTLNARELIAKTRDQITIFSVLAIILLVITLFVLFVFTTRNEEYNRLLRKAKKDAEGLAKSKQQFLANMSHEIRTPINAIIGFTNILSRSSLNKDQKEKLHIIQTASNHLLTLLNDILDFSKLQTKKLELEKVPFLISDQIEAVLDLLSVKASEKNNKLIKDLSKAELVVNGDPYRLKQIILNTVGNSIKYTEDGEIRITAETSTISPTRASLELQIDDTGIGIPESFQKKLFKEFEQAGNVPTASGTGLGLAIVKKIVDLHHGKISIQSQEGQGTKVNIRLTYALADKTDLPQSPQPETAQDFDIKEINVLIADDEPFNLKLLQAILEPHTKNITHASDGNEALNMLREKKFDIALLDIKMPGRTGFQIANEIRKVDGPNKSTPFIALTATVAEEAQLKGMKAGFNKLMRKPFSESELLQTMSLELGNTKSIVKTKPAKKATQHNFETLESLGDKNFVKDMLATFVESSTTNLSSLQLAYQEDDLKTVASMAHKTIPPARHLDATDLVDLLKDVEKLANQGIKPPATKIKSIEEIHSDLIGAISTYLK